MARVALKWTTTDLANLAGIGRMTVARFEKGNSVADETAAKLQSTFESAGVTFTSDDDRVSVAVPK